MVWIPAGKFNFSIEVLETEEVAEVEPAELHSEGEEFELLVLEVAAEEKLEEAESIGRLLEAAQVVRMELDTAMLGRVELDKGEIDAVKFEETNCWGGT